ncbi:MAG: hypothetical protein AABY38_06965 [Planctomycetota bacterium]
MTKALKDTPKNTPEEKNKFREKASEIVKKIMLKPSMLESPTNNIFMPENAELKGKLIAELESIIEIDTQEKVKKASNYPILFVGDASKATLAGCYAHCVRKVEFVANRFSKKLEEGWIKYGGNINEFEELKSTKQSCEMLSEVEGEFIYKDCFGQPIEKIWYADDPATGIKNWLELYKLGATLFLVGLEGGDSDECKIFVKNIRDIKSHFPNKLIVHTNDINKLPKYFTEQFEIIELEAEKQGRSVSVQQTKAENVFRWCGGTWEITFDGKTIRPPDSFGLKYIHYLLKHPDKEIYATELRLITGTQSRERSNKNYDEEKKDNEESSGIESGDKMNKILDSTSIEEIKRAIGYLSEKLVGAEEGEKAELLDEKTSLELHLKKATNINADSRDFSTDLEKARKAVSKCITNSLEIIKKEHTTLEQYLSTTIKMGNVFQYKHTSKIDWQLS